MHIGEAIMPHEEAVKRATQELRGMLDRNAPYYAKKPEMKPDPERPIVSAIRADDTWIYVPFARVGAGEEPLFVRVNGITKVCSIDRSF